MDSPTFQSALSTSPRVQTHSIYSPRSSVDDRGAIHKRSSQDKGRSISTSQAERLFQLATDQVNNADTLENCPTSAAGIQWITPEHSPQLNGFAPSEPTIESFPQWTVPTPPRSDSGLPSVAIEEEPVLNSGSEFADFEQPVTSEMSSLGFLLPSTYGASPYDSEHSYDMDQPYMPPMRVSQPPSTSAPSAYTSTASSEPSLYISKSSESSSSRRQSELPTTTSSSYEANYRRISSPYDSTASSAYSMPPRDSILSISGLTHSPLPSPHLSSTSAGHISPHYTTSVPRFVASSSTSYQHQLTTDRSPNPYESNPYGQTYGTSAAPSSQLYASSHSQYPPPPFVGSNAAEPPSKRHSGEGSIRVLNQRPKPQCWEHGCNGRQFSTFSNLLRHQREKSGSASKSYCPRCGAEFTRTTARNGHLAHDKCTKQQRRTSDVSK